MALAASRRDARRRGPRGGARAEGFAERCARASGGWDKEETRVSPLGLVASKSLASALVGDVETAAETLVASACDELAGAGPSARWDAAGLRRSLAALNVIALGRNADRPDPKTRVEVTTLRCYLSAITLQSAGYTPAQRSLFHHARSALKSSKAFSRFPHPAAFASLQELKSMAAVYPVDAAEGLTEISTAAAVSPALRAAAGAALDDIAVRGDVDDKPPPPPPRSQTTTTAASTGGAPTRCRWRRRCAPPPTGTRGGSPPIARSRRRCSLYVTSPSCHV